MNLDRYHPRHIRSEPLGGTGHWEDYVPRNKAPQAEFEKQFGYPADIDAVWAAREEYQNASNL